MKNISDLRDLKGASVVVTGGAGFIGSNLVDRLVQLGARVRVLDSLFSGRRENLKHVASEIEFVEGDLRDGETVERTLRGAAYVLHQGAIPSVPRSIAEPEATNDVNIRGTLNVLLSARKAGVKRITFASSSSVYGETAALPKSEDMASDPISPYAVSKLAGEAYCRSAYRVWGVEAVSLRYFNVFGPRQDPKSHYAAVVPRFVTAALKNEPLTIFGDGEQTRDFTYIDNVVEANLRALVTPGAQGEIMNIAGGDPVSVNELARRVVKLSGSRSDIVHTDLRTGDIKHSYAAVERAAAVLDFRLSVGFDEGIRKTIEWYRGAL